MEWKEEPDKGFVIMSILRVSSGCLVIERNGRFNCIRNRHKNATTLIEDWIDYDFIKLKFSDLLSEKIETICARYSTENIWLVMDIEPEKNWM